MPKALKIFFAALAIIVILAGAFILRGKKGMVDFQVNYQAAQRFRAGETLYRQQDGHYQFKYPPFSAFLYVPVSLLPLVPAKAAWFGLVLLSSFLAYYLSYVLVRPERNSRWVVGLFPPLILAKFTLREIELGQINALITCLLLGMVLWLAPGGERQARTRRDGPAGVIWGISSALKPYTAIFLPYWVLKGKWRILLTGSAVAGLAFLAPALYYGINGDIVVHKEWLASLSRSTPLLFTTQDNVSLIALFSKWTGRPALARILYISSLALLAALMVLLIAWGRKKPRAVVLESACLLVLIPLVSPLGWDYTLLSSVLAVSLILDHFKHLPRWAKAFFIINALVTALSLFDLMGRDLYAKFMALSIPTINALVLVAYLSWLRVKGRA
jgi:hypothetical protein